MEASRDVVSGDHYPHRVIRGQLSGFTVRKNPFSARERRSKKSNDLAQLRRPVEPANVDVGAATDI